MMAERIGDFHGTNVSLDLSKGFIRQVMIENLGECQNGQKSKNVSCPKKSADH